MSLNKMDMNQIVQLRDSIISSCYKHHEKIYKHYECRFRESPQQPEKVYRDIVNLIVQKQDIVNVIQSPKFWCKEEGKYLSIIFNWLNQKYKMILYEKLERLHQANMEKYDDLYKMDKIFPSFRMIEKFSIVGKTINTTNTGEDFLGLINNRIGNDPLDILVIINS
jgi:hypothetical protein